MPTSSCPKCYWNGGIEDIGLPPPPGTHDPDDCPNKPTSSCPGTHCDGCGHKLFGGDAPSHCPQCPEGCDGGARDRLTAEERGVLRHLAEFISMAPSVDRVVLSVETEKGGRGSTVLSREETRAFRSALDRLAPKEDRRG